MIKKKIRLFLKFAKYLFPYWKKEILILFLSLAGVGAGLAAPYLTKLVIDKAFTNRDLKTFIILGLIGGGIFVLIGVLNGIKSILDRYVNIKVKFDLTKALFSHVAGLHLNYFRNKSGGETHFRFVSDTDSVVGFITSFLPQVITLFPKLIITLAVVFYLNWKMAVFSLILAPFLYVPSYYFARKQRGIFKKMLKISEGAFRVLSEFFYRVNLIKAFGSEKSVMREYIRRLIKGIRTSMETTRIEAISSFAISLANRAIVGLIAFYGGYQVIKRGMSLGSLTAVMIYIRQLIGLQHNFSELFNTVAQGFISFERVDELFSQKPEVIESNRAKHPVFKKGGIVFKNVNFGYNKGISVLRNFNFEIKGGSNIAIAGRSGCGKTTILNLILRLYDPCSGEILIDGNDIRELTFASLKGQIGIALQEPFLANYSIEENIRFGQMACSFRDVEFTAKVCLVHEFIDILPSRYETVMGDDASKFSEGQKQKIAIARALIKKPKILILDEAMSSMDSASEERIAANIKQAFPLMTKILISHRLSAIKNCDKIYFLKENNDVVIGHCEELARLNEEFRDLFAGQIDNKKQYETV